jgi:hypothetical protein
MLCLGLKQPGHEADHTPLSNASKIKNVFSCISTVLPPPPHTHTPARARARVRMYVYICVVRNYDYEQLQLCMIWSFTVNKLVKIPSAINWIKWFKVTTISAVIVRDVLWLDISNIPAWNQYLRLHSGQ